MPVGQSLNALYMPAHFMFVNAACLPVNGISGHLFYGIACLQMSSCCCATSAQAGKAPVAVYVLPTIVPWPKLVSFDGCYMQHTEYSLALSAQCRQGILRLCPALLLMLPMLVVQVIELPIKHPELFESLGVAQPKVT